MTDTSKSKKTSDFIELEFDGYDPKVKAKNDFDKKVSEIKEKISQSITKNINFENGKSNLPTSMRILSDTDTHTVINLRCGSKKVFQETTLKGKYTHLQILNSLQGMLDCGKLDENVIAYANGRPILKDVSKKKKSCKKGCSKTSEPKA